MCLGTLKSAVNRKKIFAKQCFPPGFCTEFLFDFSKYGKMGKPNKPFAPPRERQSTAKTPAKNNIKLKTTKNKNINTDDNESGQPQTPQPVSFTTFYKINVFLLINNLYQITC